MAFNVSDRVVRHGLEVGESLHRFGAELVGGQIYTVAWIEVFSHRLALAEFPDAGCRWSISLFDLYTAPADVPTARSNNPATSKGKRKVNKYEEAVLDSLVTNHAVMDGSASEPRGLNGKEIAVVTGHPLNCITPRFAPLRRKGLIKDSGQRRDKQIVWVLA